MPSGSISSSLRKTFGAAIVLLAALAAPPASAQSGTSSALAGVVADKSGAVIPAAEVKATEVNTGATRTVQSNLDGRFLFSQVNPGTYRIVVRVAGFGEGQSQPVSVAVGQTATVNFALSLAATSQAVEVTAESGLMSLENANTSTTLTPRRSRACPTQARTSPTSRSSPRAR
jgi:hypothetical protein